MSSIFSIGTCTSFSELKGLILKYSWKILFFSLYSLVHLVHFCWVDLNRTGHNKYVMYTVVSYQNESFSSKWELPFLPPSSLELWRKERARKAALILMKNSQFDRTLRYVTSHCSEFQLLTNHGAGKNCQAKVMSKYSTKTVKAMML